MIPQDAKSPAKRGEDQPPDSEHGVWRFAGADRKRGATKLRCPTGDCQPASVWIKADRLKLLGTARNTALEGPLPGPWLR
jgi:hypothetical protein